MIVEGSAAQAMCASTAAPRVTSQLRELLADSEPYQSLPAVAELRERLRST